MKNRRIKIKKVSTWSTWITVVLAALFILVSIEGQKEFRVLETATEQYITCENAAKELQDGSDYLTEQVRLYAATGEKKYMDLYFEEADVTKRRENALEQLRNYFANTETFQSLKDAMYCSGQLMDTEYYAMRLVAEAKELPETNMPEEIRTTKLQEEDSLLTKVQKMEKAQKITSDDAYQNARLSITQNVSDCMKSLIEQTRNQQGRATSIFSDMYRKLEIMIVIFAAVMFAICLMLRKLVVLPLMSYNESIQKGEIFPVIGAAELQNLAETYNKVFKENQETQKLIRHQAEHDALTDALNRGSFEKLLHIYETGEGPFALILVDVDVFKSVNDTYGHAAGDGILKKVATLLKQTFRSIDYVCRIGGDEFAIIMVEMTGDLAYTISDKIAAVNEELAQAEGGLPAVSLSVGAAFSDRENPGENIFKDADLALYRVKENGKHGCAFYSGEMKKERKQDDSL